MKDLDDFVLFLRFSHFYKINKNTILGNKTSQLRDDCVWGFSMGDDVFLRLFDQ